MKDILLLKQGELVLKGQNRRHFEAKLLGNIKKRLQPFGTFSVYTAQSTVYVEAKEENCDVDGAYAAMQKVFGIVSISRARACEKEKDAILEAAKSYLADKLKQAKSFKVESKRADKRFPLNSIQLSQYVGGQLHEAFPHLIVDVHTPELIVNVEVRDYAAYVHADPVSGAGGMPVGSNGRAVTLLSGGIDSPVSSYMISRRGIQLIPVYFHAFPYTSDQAKEKVLTLAKTLTQWCGRLTVEVVHFTQIQEEIRKNCPEELFTIIMRRFMMRIAACIAERNGAKALVTGENLGQVASQTMEAMAVTQACVSLPVLQPLIGMDKEEIVKMARAIGTFETSILPYEDCCTVFTPRHPRTKPKLLEVLEAEEKLDAQALIDSAIETIERVRISVE